MQKSFFAPLALVLIVLAGCHSDKKEPRESAPAVGEQAAVNEPADAAGAIAQGKVLETMDSGGYTYVQIDTGREKVWAATNEFAVKVGDQVVVHDGTPMQDFHSSTLDRDFPLIYFSGSISVGGQTAATADGQMPAGHPAMGQGGHPPLKGPVDVDLSGIEKVPGGQTVAELFAGKDGCAGKEVLFRGKVVKVNNGILGTNWIHVRDGSGEPGTNDIAVTTSASVTVGDLVLVKGTMALDKDFGAGYVYDVIVEKAEVVKE